MANTRKLEQKPGDRKISATAGEDLTKYLLYELHPDANATVTIAGAASYDSGTPRVASKNGQPCTLDCNGILIVTAGGVIACGGPVKAAAAGKVVAATVGTDHVIGVARMDAAADGDLISISKY